MNYISNKFIDVSKLIHQLLNSKVVVQKLPNFSRNYRLISNNEIDHINWSPNNDEYFLNDDGRKTQASNTSKPFCPNCNKTVEVITKKIEKCPECSTFLQYKCMQCDNLYKHYSCIARHLKTHHQNHHPQYSLNSVANSSIARHRTNSLNKKVCPKCKKKFYHFTNLQKHIPMCSKNNLKISKQRNLKKEVVIRSNLKLIKNRLLSSTQCPKCGSNFKHSASLLKHLSYCALPPRFFCDLCSYKGVHSGNFKKHLQSHIKNEETISETLRQSEAIKISCTNCKYVIAKTKSIVCQNCKNLFKYNCIKCSLSFNSFISANYHIKKNHHDLLQKEEALNDKDQSISGNEKDDGNKILMCSKCNKKFEELRSMKKHCDYCFKEISEKCDYCDYMCKSRSNLNAHMRKYHSDNYNKKGSSVIMKKDKITQETKVTVKSNHKEPNYRVVVNYNSGKYQFTRIIKQLCRNCNINVKRISFNRQTCSNCNKNLIFECKKCSKQFDNSQKIVSHLRYKCAPEKKYFCNACSYRSYVKQALFFHLKKSHPNI